MKERAEMHQEMRSEFKAINARMDKQDQQFNTIQNSVQKLPEQMQKGLEDFVERRSCGGFCCLFISVNLILSSLHTLCFQLNVTLRPASLMSFVLPSPSFRMCNPPSIMKS
jgi:hypothetical protein